MESNITFSSIATLFGAMVVLALIPSISVLTVIARSAASGFIHGVFTTMGIVVGDIIFILVAILGLKVLAETLSSFLILVKYLGAVYLIGLGLELWSSKTKPLEAAGIVDSSLLSSFLTGLFITLGDQKAILFYLGFFPAFIDLTPSGGERFIPAFMKLSETNFLGINVLFLGGVPCQGCRPNTFCRTAEFGDPT